MLLMIRVIIIITALIIIKDQRKGNVHILHLCADLCTGAHGTKTHGRRKVHLLAMPDSSHQHLRKNIIYSISIEMSWELLSAPLPIWSSWMQIEKMLIPSKQTPPNTCTSSGRSVFSSTKIENRIQNSYIPQWSQWISKLIIRLIYYSRAPLPVEV